MGVREGENGGKKNLSLFSLSKTLKKEENIPLPKVASRGGLPDHGHPPRRVQGRAGLLQGLELLLQVARYCRGGAALGLFFVFVLFVGVNSCLSFGIEFSVSERTERGERAGRAPRRRRGHRVRGDNREKKGAPPSVSLASAKKLDIDSLFFPPPQLVLSLSLFRLSRTTHGFGLLEPLDAIAEGEDERLRVRVRGGEVHVAL